MTPPLAFISYDVKLSESERVQFIDGMALCAEAFGVDDWSAERRLPRQDWDKVVHNKIGRCDFMIVLVASGMNLAPVEEEIVEAKRCNVPFFGVYVGGAEPGVKLPDGLATNRTIPFDWARIEVAIKQVNKEGKHHIFA